VHSLKIQGYEFTRETGIYFTSLINQLFKGKYSYGTQLSSSKLKNDNFELALPIHTNGDIAFDYMEDYIKELEAERIKELEAYLAATGLNDYKLTRKEAETLDNAGG